MNIDVFYESICSLEEEIDRDLGPFLLALFPLLMDNRKNEASFDLFFSLIKEALSNEPIVFDPLWSKLTQSPTISGLTRKFTALDLEIEQKSPSVSENSFAFTLEVVKFQAAEMNRMAGKQLANEMRDFGITSDHGYNWYNFTALSVLECGIACSQDNQDDHSVVTWGTLGRILEDGRIYE